MRRTLAKIRQNWCGKAKMGRKWAKMWLKASAKPDN